MNKKKALQVFTVATALVGLMALFVVLFCGYGDVRPVEVTVDAATLGRLSLAAPPPSANGTATAASLAYNLSVAVSVRNPNFIAHVWRVAPLDAEVRIGGEPFALLRFTGTEMTDRMRPKSSRVFRAAAASEGAPVGSAGAAAFGRESAVGVFRLELVLTGEFKYGAYAGSRTATVICPLKIPLASSATATAFAAFERTLPSKCE